MKVICADCRHIIQDHDMYGCVHWSGDHECPCELTRAFLIEITEETA